MKKEWRLWGFGRIAKGQYSGRRKKITFLLAVDQLLTYANKKHVMTGSDLRKECALKNGEYWEWRETTHHSSWAHLSVINEEAAQFFPLPKSRGIASRSQSSQTIYRALHHLSLSHQLLHEPCVYWMFNLEVDHSLLSLQGVTNAVKNRCRFL